jgi:hypothetical protein
MKIIIPFKIIGLLLLWALTPGASFLWAQADSPPAAASSAPSPNLLGMEYADIRNGFTIRPPFNSEFAVRGGTTGPQPDSAPALPLLKDWEILKSPESNELVRFFEPRQKITLIVCLLATRGKMEIEQIAEARQSVWQKFPQQAQIQQVETTEIKKCPAALFDISWLISASEQNRLFIREAIVQADKNRFFLLTLLKPSHTDEDGLKQSLTNAVIKNFECLDSQKQQLRWRQARQHSQQFLETFKFDEARIVLEKDRWYRVIHRGEDIGYTHVSEQWLKQQGTQSIQIDHDSFIKNAEPAPLYTQALGWTRTFSDESDNIPIGPGTVKLQGRFELDSNLKEEKFTLSILSQNNGNSSYTEQGHWNEKTLSAQRRDGSTTSENNITETLEVNDKIYLSWVHAELLTRLLKYKTGDEYVFLRYGNFALHYFTLRVAGSADLKVAPLEKTTSPPAESSDDQTLKTTYLLGQIGPQGPIVQTWVDDKGRIVKQIADDITILSSTAEKINELWPDETKKPKTNPPPKKEPTL